jgi:hypothetical protein
MSRAHGKGYLFASQREKKLFVLTKPGRWAKIPPTLTRQTEQGVTMRMPRRCLSCGGVLIPCEDTRCAWCLAFIKRTSAERAAKDEPPAGLLDKVMADALRTLNLHGGAR